MSKSSMKLGVCEGACSEGKAGALEEGGAAKDARPLLLGSTSSVNKSNSTEWVCVTEGRGASDTSSTSSKSKASTTGADVANDERRLNGLGGFAGWVAEITGVAANGSGRQQIYTRFIV